MSQQPSIRHMILALAAIFCFAVLAEEVTKPPVTQAPVPDPAIPIYSFECMVQGTPVEFPDDLQIKNGGNTTIVKGTVLHWSIPNTSRQGDYTLTEDLAPGKWIFVSGVIGGGMSAGMKCSVTVKEKKRLTANPPRTVSVAKQPVLSKITQLGCIAQGTPVEFPDDIVLTNNGATTIAKGKVVHWAIPNTTRQGDYTLTDDLASGKSVFVGGVLGGGVGAGTKCTAVVK